jgi:hypothetical protein
MLSIKKEDGEAYKEEGAEAQGWRGLLLLRGYSL